VQLPAVVQVPAGSSAAQFAIPTLRVGGESFATVTASYGGGSPWAELTLENASPAAIYPLRGDGQTVTIGSLFPVALAAKVLDAVNNPVPGVAVQFTAPTSGPAGLFPGAATSVSATTDASGVATAPAFTANSFKGPYAIAATTPAVAIPAFFNLVNGGLGFYTVAPCRIVDTRNPTGTFGGPRLQVDATRIFPVTNLCGIPATARAISANVTVTGATAAGSLVIARADQTLPMTSNISFGANQTLANNAVLNVALDGSGSIVVGNQTSGTVHFILDVNGYYQ
jgi:hypothetical protein